MFSSIEQPRHFSSVHEQATDGCFLGAGGMLYPPTSDVRNIPAILPNNGAPVIDTLAAINGIMTDSARHYNDLQLIANSGAAVIGVRNASGGLQADILEYLRDRFEMGMTRPIETLMRVIRSAVEEPFDLHVLAHSQGALMLSRALKYVQANLAAEKLASATDIQKQFAHLRIETYGGGVPHYPPGPQYVHVDNEFDPVSQFLGLNSLKMRQAQKQQSERGAIFRRLSELNPEWKDVLKKVLRKEHDGPWLIDQLVHGSVIYYPKRVSFAEALRMTQRP